MLHWNKCEHLSNICCTYSCIRHGLLKYFCCQTHHLGCLSQFWHYICHCIEQKKRTKRAKRGSVMPIFFKRGVRTPTAGIQIRICRRNHFISSLCLRLGIRSWKLNHFFNKSHTMPIQTNRYERSISQNGMFCNANTF